MISVNATTTGKLPLPASKSKSTARVVATLERKGYVGRATHPGDGRAVLLDVTSAGRRLHDRIREDRVAERTAVLAAFAPEVRAGVIDVMRRVADATQQRIPQAPRLVR